MRRNAANNRKNAVIEKIEGYSQVAPDRYGKDGWELFLHRPLYPVVDIDHYEVYNESNGAKGFIILRRWYTKPADIHAALVGALVKLFAAQEYVQFAAVCGDFTEKESYDYFIVHGDFYPIFSEAPHLKRRVAEHTDFVRSLYILAGVYFPRVNFQKVYADAALAAWDILREKEARRAEEE